MIAEPLREVRQVSCYMKRVSLGVLFPGILILTFVSYPLTGIAEVYISIGVNFGPPPPVVIPTPPAVVVVPGTYVYSVPLMLRQTYSFTMASGIALIEDVGIEPKAIMDHGPMSPLPRRLLSYDTCPPIITACHQVVNGSDTRNWKRDGDCGRRKNTGTGTRRKRRIRPVKARGTTGAIERIEEL